MRPRFAQDQRPAIEPDTHLLRETKFRTGRSIGNTIRSTSTRAEIEGAADALADAQKKESFLFLAAKRRAVGQLPESRTLASGRIAEWISTDEADLRRFNGWK